MPVCIIYQLPTLHAFINVLYTVTLITMLIPTYSVRYVILFRETGVVQRNTYIFKYFFLFIY